MFLQAAGTPPGQTRQFGESIRTARTSADWHWLKAELQSLKFDVADSSYISIAVAATSDLAPPACPFLRPTDRFREQFADLITVLFLFNVVNRVANAYGLKPEWDELRRSERLRRWTRWPMSIGLSRQMLLDADDSPPVDSLTGKLAECLQLLQVTAISSTWQLFECVPANEVAVCQLLLVSLQCPDNRQLNLLLPDSSQSDNPIGGSDPTERQLSDLMATPPRPGADLLTTLRRFGLTEASIADAVLRASLLAAIRILNRNWLADLAAVLDHHTA